LGMVAIDSDPQYMVLMWIKNTRILILKKKRNLPGCIYQKIIIIQ